MFAAIAYYTWVMKNKQYIRQLNRRFFDADKVDFDNLLFDRHALFALLMPVVIEQLLSAFMGTADSMMVARAGSAAISAVSVTDSINVLFIQLFAALAAGGTIICSHFIGQGDIGKTNRAAQQILLTIAVLSCAAGAFCFAFNEPLLRLIFGSVDEEVMRDAVTYFSFTTVSFPFFALFQAGGAFYRACGNSRFPMLISVSTNVMNIVGNAVFIFGFGWGVAGAALSTLLSRIIGMIWIMAALRRGSQEIVIRHYLIRPDPYLIKRVLAIGIPSGLENSMFQFGKLVIQSSVSTLGTTAIAANAMASLLESLSGVVGIGIGIGMMTIVGQCLGAGRTEEAKYYIVKLTEISEVCVTLCSLLLLALTPGINWLAGLEPAAAKLCFDMVIYIMICKPFFWSLSFVIAYGLRAAGDVKFCMISSMITMWTFRVTLTIILIRMFGVGPIAVWIGMSADWAIRGVIYTKRFLSGRWLNHEVT